MITNIIERKAQKKPPKPGRRRYCIDCQGHLEPERARCGIESCRKCIPGWPTDEVEI